MQESTNVQFKLRLPSALRAKLEEASDESGLSVSAEIIKRLEESFSARDQLLALMLQLQGAIALAENTVKTVREAVQDLERQKAEGKPWKPHAVQDPSIDVEIEKGKRSLAYFEKDLRLKGYALQYIAEQRAAGEEVSADHLRAHMEKLGVSLF